MTKKIPATCYSPMAYTTVPSPLRPLTTVFGMGTRVSSSLLSPGNFYLKKLKYSKLNITAIAQGKAQTLVLREKRAKKMVKPHG